MTRYRAVGRDDDLAALDAFHTEQQANAALVLCGDPGVGKSFLLDIAADTAERRGVAVIRASGVQFDADVSYAGLGQLLAPVHDHLVELTEIHRSALSVVLGLGHGAPPTPVVVANAALLLLNSAADDQPIELIVDDLHWLDRTSAVVLAFVARRSAQGSVRFLGSTRPMSEFAQSAGIPMHWVSPLTEQASADLLSARFPSLSERARQLILVEAQGNPLALLELATAQEQQPGTLNVPQLSGRLMSLYAARIQALPQPTRELLLVAALDGSGGVAIPRAATHGPGLEALAPAEHDQLITVHGDRTGITFHHPLVRSTIVDLARDIERRRAHYVLADALRDQPERRAWHLARAATEADEAIAALLEDTARATLRRGDAVTAADTLVRASELSPRGTDRSRRLIEAAALRAEVTGDLGDASHMLASALRDEPALTDSLQATLTAAHLLINAQCAVDDAHRLLVAAIEKYPNSHDPHDQLLIASLHALVVVCWMSDRADLWVPLDVAIARLSPLPPTVLSLCRNAFGNPAYDAHIVLDQIGAVLATLPAERNPVTITHIALGCVYVDRLADCREPLRRVVRDGRAGGAIALSMHALTSICVHNWWAGRWAEVDELAAEGLVLCERHGYRRYAFILGGYIKALVGAARGDTDSSSATAEDLADLSAATGSGVADVFAHHLRSMNAIAGGDFEEAYHEAAAISPAGTLRPYSPHALWVLLDLVEAAARTGRHDEASAHVGAMRAAGLSRISPRLALVSAGCAAMTAPEREASMLFERALAIRDAWRWPFDYARIQLIYGEHLRRIGAVTQASRPLKAASETFSTLGARPWAKRAGRELRGTRQPTLTLPITDRSSTLSAHDLQTASLAASGLSNKEIAQRLNVSDRTVSNRLYRIYPLLGVSSRSQLYEALQNLQRGT